MGVLPVILMGTTDIVTFILSVYDVMVCVLACVSAVLVFLAHFKITV